MLLAVDRTILTLESLSMSFRGGGSKGQFLLVCIMITLYFHIRRSGWRRTRWRWARSRWWWMGRRRWWIGAEEESGGGGGGWGGGGGRGRGGGFGGQKRPREWKDDFPNKKPMDGMPSTLRILMRSMVCQLICTQPCCHDLFLLISLGCWWYYWKGQCPSSVNHPAVL